MTNTQPLTNIESAFHAVNRRDWQVAEQLCQATLATDPDNADGLHLLALTYKLSGRLAECLPVYERLTTRHANAPFIPTVLGNYSNALRDASQFATAERHLRRALTLKPNAPDLLNHLGLVRQDLGDLNEASQLFERSLALDPKSAEAWNNYGGVLQRQSRANDALAAYRRALQLRPDFAEAHYNLGNLLADSHYLDESIIHYRAALVAKPDYVEATQGWLRQAQNACAWNDLPALSDTLRDRVRTRGDGRVFPFAFVGIDTTAQEQFACAKQWAETRYYPLAANTPPRAFTCKPKPRLRIGYLSSDFHNHATAYLLAELIELHDRSQFEVIAYSASPDDGKDMRQRLLKAFDKFVDIENMAYARSAQIIADDGIDILVDLKGYTRETRAAILAFRPAPVTVSYLGYPGTLGAPIADYVITDRHVSPPEFAEHFVEKLVYMPDCYQPNDRRRRIGATVTRQDVGLPETGVVFCCFNHTYKITPEVFDAWCTLLRDTPNSVLWLLQSNSVAKSNLATAASERGIDPNRLYFAPNLPLADHLARIRCADIFLDTYPVNAHTTASDALWAGIPVVTLSGETFISRVAGSLLSATGLPELITNTLDNYIQCARELARDPARIQAYKDRLVTQRASLALFDTERYTRALERRYQQIWTNTCAGHHTALID